MKTQEVLEQLRKDNIRIPSSWVVMQSRSGVFLGFITSCQSKEEVQRTADLFREKISDRMLAERDAVRQSKTTEL